MCINRDNNVNIDDIDEKYENSNKFFNLKNKFKEMFKKVRKAKKKNKKY